MKIQDSNYVELAGIVTEIPIYNHEYYGEKFYTAFVESRRSSGAVDKIQIMISDVILGWCLSNIVDKNVVVRGSYRSYNKYTDDGKRKVVLCVFVDELLYADDADLNEINLVGYICKQPTYRKTPRGREISDVLLAVNRSYGKSDYIPCIFWGRNARRANVLMVGDKISIVGRIQSREYVKKIEDREEIRMACEVSAFKLEVLEDEK